MDKYHVTLHVETQEGEDRSAGIRKAFEVAAHDVPEDILKVDVDRVVKVKRWPPIDIYRWLMFVFFVSALIGGDYKAAAVDFGFLMLFLGFDYRDYRKNRNWRV